MTRHNQFELIFFDAIKDKVECLVDIGCRDDVEYFLIKPTAKMHLFDINNKFIDIGKSKISNKENNKNVNFYNFGLSNTNSNITYSTVSESIHRTWGSPEEGIVKKFDEVLAEYNIRGIDFLKMDIEGSEPEILFFKTILNDIKFIQFEYGPTWNHSLLKLEEIITKYDNHKFYFLKDVNHPMFNNESALLKAIDDKVLTDIEYYITQDCGCNIVMIRQDITLQ